MTTKADDPETTETTGDTGDTDSGDTDSGGGAGVTLQHLADKVDALAGRVARLARGSGSHTTRAADSGEDMAAQVRTEVEKIKAAETRDKAEQDRIGALAAKVDQIAEKAPREYRPVTRFMWGEDE